MDLEFVRLISRDDSPVAASFVSCLTSFQTDVIKSSLDLMVP